MSSSARMNSSKGSHKSSHKKSKSNKAKKDSKKKKKLNDKGRVKLAEHRARERLEQLKQERADAQAQAEEEGVDYEPEPDMDDDEQLEMLKQQELKEIESDEMRRKLSKLQTKHNQMQNVIRSGQGQKIGVYDRDYIDLKVVQKIMKKEKHRLDNIQLTEAVPCIKQALEAGCLGKKKFHHFLSLESTQSEFAKTDLRLLKQSLDVELHGREQTPINFRVEMLWRFSCLIQDYPGGNKEQNLRLALYGYELLIDKCDDELHPFQYAALQNCKELAEIELNTITGYRSLSKANKDFEFEPPDNPSSNFNFEKKSNS